MMGLNLIIYVSHNSVNPAESLKNICPGDLTSKAGAGNHPNVVFILHTSRSQDPYDPLNDTAGLCDPDSEVDNSSL